MMLIGMIGDLWSIGKEVFSMTDKIKGIKKEQRDRLADLLEHIGQVLSDTYKKLDAGQYPAGNCEQLEVFSEELKTKLEPVEGAQKAELLANKLKQVHEVEKLYGMLSNGQIQKEELLQLDEAAGYFIATAKLLRT